MYSVQYINTIEQFGHTYTTVIITDGAGVYPDIRIDKQYPPSENLTKSFLINDCIQDIYTYNNLLAENKDLDINFNEIIS